MRIIVQSMQVQNRLLSENTIVPTLAEAWQANMVKPLATSKSSGNLLRPFS